MSILDNEGHDPNGLGNRRSYATEIMELRYHYAAMEAALAVRDAEIARLQSLCESLADDNELLLKRTNMTTSAAKANRNAEIVDRLEAEIARLRLQNVNLRHAINWACGEAPDGNDQWFSDVMPETKPGERPKPYWWRSHLRRVAGLVDEQLLPAKED